MLKETIDTLYMKDQGNAKQNLYKTDKEQKQGIL